MRHGDEFLAYATNAQGDRANVQMARSTNLVDWTLVEEGGKLHDAMPVLPPWARGGFTWAPEVLRTKDGFVLHFTAKDRSSDLQCIGSAFSASPFGPFTSRDEKPLVCQTEIGGTIDSHAFRDEDGANYLYFKNDGNNPKFGKKTDIFVQRLSSDGMRVEGEAVSLLRNDTEWEAHVIEAPTMVRHANGYALFYSANHFGWEKHQRLSPYAIGYAVCKGPMGPCTDSPSNPILYSYNDRKAGCLSGPGHQSVFDVGGKQFIAFHGWAATKGCRRFDNRRYLYIAPLLWKDGVPQIGVSLRRTPAQ
ncbi:family 43 glycosylhydrolase [Sphingorhabdus contaminans]|uniref:Family 43 glycosylhydrolase n=2 Tax=Sphingorhabdus contaminans TaxID=1343899 RepID=A0A553WL92_9SPHN|nr:family 43 glycosylhydrolase [Sphingorhabdus contaminans]